MPSQQSSFRGTRTVLTPCHEAMAATEASSDQPSKMPRPCTHWYSVPDRLTPWRAIVRPAPSTSRLPETWTARTPGALGGAGRSAGVPAAEPVGLGAGAGADEALGLEEAEDEAWADGDGD